MKRPQMQIMMLCTTLFFLTILSGCQLTKPTSEGQVREPLTDFRQIEGVTQEDINQVEAILSERDQFIWDSVLSPAAYQEGDEIKGSTALLAEHIGDLFNVEIEIRNGLFPEVRKHILEGTADFTMDLVPTMVEDPLISTTGVEIRKLNIYSTVGLAQLNEIEKTRPLRYVFVEHSNVLADFDQLVGTDSEKMMVYAAAEAAEVLLSGEADALVLDEASSMRFESYPEIITEKYPRIPFYSTGISTGQEELRPIIDVLQKYLNSKDSIYISSLNIAGEEQYQKYLFNQMLTEEERDYLLRHQGDTVEVSMLHDDYAATFYDSHTGTVEGMGAGVLDEITKLTGLTFDIKNDRSNAKIYINLLQEEINDGSYLRCEQPYAEYQYVLLSMAQEPNVEYMQIRNKMVGYRSGSAFESMYTNWFPNDENVIAYEDSAVMFEALAKGEVDLVLTTEAALYYATHYLEEDSIKVNYAFDAYDGNYFYFDCNENLLRSIVEKAQTQVDIEKLNNILDNRLYTYKGQALRQTIFLTAAALVFVAFLAVMMFTLSKQNKRLAENDPLTKLPNRRVFERKLNESVAASYDDSISVWFADIDDFKQINDSYGHDFGDEVLVACADALARATRTSERPFRFGGEEFVGILPKTSEIGACVVAQRALDNVRVIRFEQHPELRVTVSIGICTDVVGHTHNLNGEQLLVCADAAMYMAKRAGKNRFVVYQDGMTKER